MADQKITDLTAHTAPIGTDVLPIVDITADSTKKITIDTLNDSFTKNSLYRQAIINGNFDVWQRGTSFSGGAIYTADRWKAAGAAGQTIVRSTDVPNGYGYSLQLTCTLGSNWLDQNIESANSANLAGKTVTLSCWFKNVSGSLASGIELNYANATDNFSATTNIGTYSFDDTTSWVKYTYTVALPAGAANGIQVRIITQFGAVSSVQLIAQVQICVGSVALPFQPKSFADELKDCQRYYQTKVVRTINGIMNYGLPVDLRTTPGTATASAGTIANAIATGYQITHNANADSTIILSAEL